MSKTIGVVFGGPSPEHDISILTGLQSVRILSKKYEVIALYWSKNNEWYLVDNEYESVDFLSDKKIYKNKLEMKFNDDPGFYQKRKKLQFDVLINACHGGPGEDGSLQSLLNIFRIKYTGPDQISAQICMDKYAFYTVMKENGLPVIEKKLVNAEEMNIDGNYVLKPRFGGSSIGVEYGDIDHLFGSLFAIAKLHTDQNILWLHGEQEILFPESESIKIGINNKFSVLPFSDLINLNITGAEWNLENENIEFGQSKTLRNIARNEKINISVSDGKFCLIIYS